MLLEALKKSLLHQAFTADFDVFCFPPGPAFRMLPPMSPPDIRWKQRFQNYAKAVGQMTKFIEKGDLNPMEEQGLIQSFEYTYELAWTTLKDFFEDQGETNLLGSRDAFRLAFKRGLFEDGETWMKMIESRALTSHTYNEETARAIAQSIRGAFFAEFVKLRSRLETLSRQAE